MTSFAQEHWLAFILHTKITRKEDPLSVSLLPRVAIKVVYDSQPPLADHSLQIVKDSLITHFELLVIWKPTSQVLKHVCLKLCPITDRVRFL